MKTMDMVKPSTITLKHHGQCIQDTALKGQPV